MNKILRNVVLVMALSSGMSAHAKAEVFPVRQITMVVPFAAGSATDSLARFLAEGLGKKLETTIVVENKPGANGAIGAHYVAGAAKDGSVLLLTSNSHAANVSLYKRLSYDPVKDFTPIARVMRLPLVLVTRPDFGAQSVEDVIEIGRKRPTGLTYGSGNTSSQVAVEMLMKPANVQVVRVPFSGNNLALTELMAGRIDLVVADMTTALPQINANFVKAIAVASTTRATILPNVPTIAESGFPDYEVIGWLAVFGPAGMPADRVARINSELASIVNDPTAQAFFAKVGGEPFSSSPSELATFVEREIQRWANFVAIAGIEKQ